MHNDAINGEMFNELTVMKSIYFGGSFYHFFNHNCTVWKSLKCSKGIMGCDELIKILELDKKKWRDS